MKLQARALLFALATACGLSACQNRPPAPTTLRPALRKAVESGYVPQRHYATAELRKTWSHDGERLDVSFIAPSSAGDVRFPLIVYLPGLGEPASSSALWRRAWAQAGYAVLSVQPLKLTQRIWASPMALAGDFEGLAKKEYSAQSAARRIDALNFALSELRRRASAGEALFRTADLSRIALAGFDLGGQTVALFIAGSANGALARATESDIRAAIILSPLPAQAEPGAAPRWAALSLPVLSITGTDDEDPLELVGSPELRQDPWKSMPPGGKYLLVLTGGNHEVLAGDSLVNPESLRQSEPGDHGSRERRRPWHRGGWRQRGGDTGDELNVSGTTSKPFKLADAAAAPQPRRRGGSRRGSSGPRGYDARQIAAIEDVSTAFLAANVKDEARAQTWLAEDAAGWLRGSALLKAK